MNAAALLLRLDAEATKGPWVGAVDEEIGNPTGIVLGQKTGWVCDTDEWEGDAPDVRCITTTRNLLPLLARLVGAVGAYGECAVVSAGHRITQLERDQLKTILEAIAALDAEAARQS